MSPDDMAPAAVLSNDGPASDQGAPLGRSSIRTRTTRETSIRVELVLDGTGRANVHTGVGFYDHLLSSLAHHALFDLSVEASGDLEVDEHHTVEDVALTLGEALSEALGDRAGITRFGDASVPMDLSLIHI